MTEAYKCSLFDMKCEEKSIDVLIQLLSRLISIELLFLKKISTVNGMSSKKVLLK